MIIFDLAQEYLIAAALVKGESAAVRRLAHVTRNHFSRKPLSAIWAAICEVAQQRDKYELFDVIEQLERAGDLATIPTPWQVYFGRLMDGHYRSDNLTRYADALEDHLRHKKDETQ